MKPFYIQIEPNTSLKRDLWLERLVVLQTNINLLSFHLLQRLKSINEMKFIFHLGQGK